MLDNSKYGDDCMFSYDGYICCDEDDDGNDDADNHNDICKVRHYSFYSPSL